MGFMDMSHRWEGFLHHIGGVPAGTFNNVLDPRYSEVHRKYHNLNHIRACLEMFDEYVHKDVPHRLCVEMAIWFHDVVYESASKTNEEDSAKLFLVEAKKMRLGPDFCQEVESFILATKSHLAPKDPCEAMAYFLDIDLSILGMKDEDFDEYEKGIREEYAWVPEQAYVQGRSDILRSFLDRDWVFLTKEFRRLYEGPARANIKRSLARLSGK